MIDLRLVAANGLWIVGASMTLAAFSYYSWLAQSRRRRVRDVLQGTRGWPLARAGGLWLVASGFLMMETTGRWMWWGWLALWVSQSYELWRLRPRT